MGLLSFNIRSLDQDSHRGFNGNQDLGTINVGKTSIFAEKAEV